MKIVVATSMYLPEIGRPAAYVRELSARLIREGHEVFVIAYSDAPNGGDIPLVRISKRIPRAIRMMKYAQALLKASKGADLVYIQNALSAGLPAALASLARGVPYLVKFWGDEAWERARKQRRTAKQLDAFLSHPEGGIGIRLMRRAQAFVLRHAKVVAVPSLFMRGLLVNAYGLDLELVRVLNDPADTPEALPFKTIRASHRIAAISTLSSAKDTDDLHEAYTLVKKKYPDATLSEEENVSKAERWHIIGGAGVFVVNATNDIKPYAVLQGFAKETPVVATNINGKSEIIKNGESGLIVPHNDAEALARAIISIFDDPARAQRLTKNGKELLVREFSWDAHLRTLTGMFQAVTGVPSHVA